MGAERRPTTASKRGRGGAFPLRSAMRDHGFVIETDAMSRKVRPDMQHELPHLGRLLTVVAHPDDESFGLGALVSVFVDGDTSVSLLCFTRGEATTLGGGAGDPRDVRASELACAAQALGVGDVKLLSYPDGALSAVPSDTLAGQVKRAASGAEAVLVFDTDGVTGHPDHRAATRAALAAAEDLDLPVLAWAIPRSVAAALNTEFGTAFTGRDRSEVEFELRVDRSRQLRAIRCHHSQSSANPVVWRRLERQEDREWMVVPRHGPRRMRAAIGSLEQQGGALP